MNPLKKTLRNAVIAMAAYGLISSTVAIAGGGCLMLLTESICASADAEVETSLSCVNCSSISPEKCWVDSSARCYTGETSGDDWETTEPSSTCEDVSIICEDAEGVRENCGTCDLDTETECRKGKTACATS